MRELCQTTRGMCYNGVMVTATKLRRTICGFLVAVIATLHITPAVFAIDSTTRQKFGQNNILFYDPDGDNCNTVSFTAKPTGDQITWIGDSYSVQAENKGLISGKLPGVDLGGAINTPSSYIQGSKFVSHGSDSNPSGFEILRNIIAAGNLRPYLVFALGTNGGWSDSDITEFQSILSGKDTKVVLVTSKIPSNSYTDSNNRLKNFAQSNPNIYLADWTTVYQESFFAGDSERIHPITDPGYQTWVDLIYNTLPGGSVGLVAGNTLHEKIWNYFATAGINGVSNNPAAIAGIIGNLDQESGGNPFSHTAGSQYYGVYQTYAPEMLAAIAAAGLDQYWGSSSAPDEAVNAALQIELDYLTQKNDRFVGTGWAAEWGFLKSVPKMTNQTPEAYSDLFLVTVEGAVTSNTVSPYTGKSNEIKDPVALNVGTTYFRNNDGGGRYYQEAQDRRDKAASFYSNFAGMSVSSLVASYSGSGVSWEDGWLMGMPGIIKQDVTSYELSETLKSSYSTPDGKPNKILLHNTEGTGNGFSAYGSNTFPAHFIIDLKKKEGYQNLPITAPALATVGSDGDTVQIEIVGWVYGSKPENPYDLSNFTAEDWDYLAAVLAAISAETGIPLTTSVNWEGSNVRVSDASTFSAIQGIVGHMHSPGDSHTDPGNIWPALEAAIARNPSASQFGGIGVCQLNADTGLISGGMSLAQAEQFMETYRSISPRSYPNPDFAKWNIPDTVSCQSDLENCVAFSSYFIHEYTTANLGLPDGGQVVQRLLSSGQGFIDGGHTPKAYAIFSHVKPGEYGHTGVVLGVDAANDKIIIGEAGCGASFDWTGAHEYSLSEWSGSSYYYAYTDNILKRSL